MSKTTLSLLACSLLLAVSCTRNDTREKTRAFADAYGAITGKHADQSRELSAGMLRAASQPDFVRLRDEYNRLQKDHRREVENLLNRFADAPGGDELTLLRGRALLELDRFDEAGNLLDALAAKGSPHSSAARFEKIKIHIVRRQLPEALALFRQIDRAVPRDPHYFSFMMYFAMEAEPADVRREFSRRLMAAGDLPAEFQASRPRLIASLAHSARLHGDLTGALELMRQELGAARDPLESDWLRGELGQLEQIGKPALPWSIDLWLNGPPPSPANLRGRVVLVNFWAPWCQPCRDSMPSVSRMARDLAGRGLVVVGLTRLYGNYADDRGSRGAVKPDEETALIRDFARRHGISYPLAVDRQGGTFAAFHVTALPTLALIDRQGIVRQLATGATAIAALNRQAEELLEEKP